MSLNYVALKLKPLHVFGSQLRAPERDEFMTRRRGHPLSHSSSLRNCGSVGLCYVLCLIGCVRCQHIYLPRALNKCDCGKNTSLLPARMLRAGSVFGGVCESVSLWVCALSAENIELLLVGNRCNLVEICQMGNARSVWKLVTFDLDFWPWELFSYFFNSGYNFWMVRPSNFILSLRHFQNI